MLLTIDEIRNAEKNLKGVVRRTPLFFSDTFSVMCGGKLYLKCENKQKTGAFKFRGAYNKLSSLTEEEKSKGVIAASSGNHAQGTAYAASVFGVKATIAMPLTSPAAKVMATKGYGAEVVQAGQVYDECYAKALELQKETGATFMHPFDDLHVMAGQGTIGLEIMEDLPEADVVVVPIGGGGVISGVATAVKSLKPGIRVVGVEPEVIASAKASIERGEVTTLPAAASLADGIVVATPGKNCFESIRKYVDEIVTVSDEEIEKAIFLLLQRSKLMVEGAGAAALAAVLSGKVKDIKGKNVVVLCTGGNIDTAKVAEIIGKFNK